MSSLTKKILSAFAGLSLLTTTGCMTSSLPYVHKKPYTIDNVPINPKSTNENLHLYLTAKDGGNFTTPDKNISSYTLENTEQGNLTVVKYTTKPEKEIKNDNIIVYLNGLESNCSWFSPVAKKLAKKGIETHALDRRGSGVNMRIKGDQQDWINDTDKLFVNLYKENPNSNIHLIAACFGSRLGTAYALDENIKGNISSIIYISPSLETKIKPNFLETLTIISSALLNNPDILVDSPIKDTRMFARDKASLDKINQDRVRVVAPRALDLFYGFNLMGKIENTSNKIYSPILVLYSENDEVSDIPETSEKILEVSSSKAEFINFPCCKHFLPLEAPDKVTELISQWFDKFE